MSQSIVNKKLKKRSKEGKKLKIHNKNWMIITALLILAFFMPLILSKAEWEMKTINLYTNESGYISTDVEYGIGIYVAENYMGEESHRPLLTIDVIIDEGDPSDYTGVLWYFILYSGSKEDFLNGVATELSKESNIGYWGFAEFEVNKSGDYVVSYEFPDFETSTNYWFNVDVYLDLWWYVWEEETTTTTTIKTTSSVTPTTQITSRQNVVKTMTLNPSADTYIDMKDSDTNFGGTDWLYVGYSPVTDWINSKTFLSFSITQLPDDATIKSAVLKLSWFFVEQTYSVSIVEITSFEEYSVTWNNAPTVPKTSIDTILVGSSDWHSFDVTSAINKNGKIYFGIYTTTESSLYSAICYSKENGYKIPELIIEYSIPTSETTTGFIFLTIIGLFILKKKNLR